MYEYFKANKMHRTWEFYCMFAKHLGFADELFESILWD